MPQVHQKAQLRCPAGIGKKGDDWMDVSVSDPFDLPQRPFGFATKTIIKDPVVSLRFF